MTQDRRNDPPPSPDRPSALRACDLILGILLLGSLAWTASAGAWGYIVAVLAIAATSAVRDLVRDQ